MLANPLICTNGVLTELLALKSYISQVRRNLVTRIEDHVPNGKSNQESDVVKHSVGNPNHKFNCGSPEMLGHCKCSGKLPIKESLIKTFNHK